MGNKRDWLFGVGFCDYCLWFLIINNSFVCFLIISVCRECVSQVMWNLKYRFWLVGYCEIGFLNIEFLFVIVFGLKSYLNYFVVYEYSWLQIDSRIRVGSLRDVVQGIYLYIGNWKLFIVEYIYFFEILFKKNRNSLFLNICLVVCLF